MQGGDAGDAVELLVSELPITNVGELEVDVEKLRRTLAREANHFGRQVKGQHVVGTFGETPGEGARTATDFEGVMAVRWQMSQQEVVIVIVVSGAVF